MPYNYKANEDPSIPNCLQTDTQDDHPILHREVEAAVQSLKKGKSAGVNNIPAERVLGGPVVHDLQAYRKMDETREHIICILELRGVLLSFQTGFNTEQVERM